LKSENFTIKELGDISNVIDFSKWENEENLLIQIFSGQGSLGLIKVSAICHKELPQAKIIGSTTDGEISDIGVFTRTIVVSISSFENTQIRGHLFTEDLSDAECGKLVAEKLVSDRTKLLIIFTDSSPIFNVERFLDGISSVAPDVIVAGGIGGNNGILNGVAVLYETAFTLRGVSAVVLDSDILDVKNNYNFNWQPIGKSFTVTKADENQLFELNGKKAIDVYKKYFGEDVANSLSTIGIEFPLIVQRNNIDVARAMLGINRDGSLSFAGSFEEGEKARFGIGNIDLILEDSIKNISSLPSEHIQAVFIYSCMARRRLMPNHIYLEIEPFYHIAPTSGFFTYGEFFHSNKNNELFNQTMTYVTLSENIALENTYEPPRTVCSNDLNSLRTVKSLVHFLNAVVDELYETQKDNERKSKIINDSLQHALFLQKSIMPETKHFHKYFKDHFIIWRPRDKVGGDIYFFQEFREEAVLILVDAIGHGIPGALITMSIKATENLIVKRFRNITSISPTVVLQMFKENFENITKSTNQTIVGFDGAVIIFNKRHHRLLFAGANIGLCYIDNDGSLVRVNGDKMSIENNMHRTNKASKRFTEHQISIPLGRKFYISSDGFKDQIGGSKGFPFGRKRCAKEFQKVYKKPFHEQKEKIVQVLEDWKGGNEQTDDITIIGFEVN
jgi:serine phosphatase RsbU (regulator of sigma subunit)